MKNVFIFLLIAILAAGGVWFIRKNRSPQVIVPSTTATFTSDSTGIKFTYPKVLSVSEKDGIITLHHEVPFEHHDYCDFKGEIDTTIPTLTDFGVAMHIQHKGLVDTMKTESPYIPQENFVDDDVVVSPGFIDEYNAGALHGYAIFEGAEGCGVTTYYFPITNNSTLVVKRDFITVFSGSIDTEHMAQAAAVPGVIVRDKEEEMFESILKSLTVD